MAYVGIGYTGEDNGFLRGQVDKHLSWLKGDRNPRFFGDRFIVLYDSNTAREFIQKCRLEGPSSSITVYPMSRPWDA